jgi:hypothetical protein
VDEHRYIENDPQVTDQTQHAVQRLNVDDDLREGDLLTGRQLVLYAGNKSDETENEGSDRTDLVLKGAYLIEDTETKKREHEDGNEDSSKGVPGTLVNGDDEMTVLVVSYLRIVLFRPLLRGPIFGVLRCLRNHEVLAVVMLLDVELLPALLLLPHLVVTLLVHLGVAFHEFNET